MGLMLVSTLSASLLPPNSLNGQSSPQNEASFFWASKQSCAGGCGSHGPGADTEVEWAWVTEGRNREEEEGGEEGEEAVFRQ